MNLKNKVAIITGARRGMGKAHSLTLAKAGAKVIVSDLVKEDCQKVVDEIKKEGGEAIAVKCDISKKEEVDAMVQKAVEEFGRVDILVNNAGIADFKPFLEMTEKDWNKTININLKGYFLCTRACAEIMAEQKSGNIINIASIAMGQVGAGFMNLAHYCASKGGIVAMAEELAVELAPYNIRVNTIAPGVIDTPMASSVKDNEEALKSTLSRVPMNRMGKAQEIADAVLFLASDKSSYINGEVIVVDGGYLAS